MINPQTKTFQVSTLRFWMLQRHSTNIGLCEHSWYSDSDATSVTLQIQIRGGQTKDLTHSQNYELSIEFEIVSFI